MALFSISFICVIIFTIEQSAQMVQMKVCERKDLGSIPGPNVFMFSDLSHAGSMHLTPMPILCAHKI